MKDSHRMCSVWLGGLLLAWPNLIDTKTQPLCMPREPARQQQQQQRRVGPGGGQQLLYC